MACPGMLTKLYQKMRENLWTDNENDPQLDVQCTYCTRKQRVGSLDDLKPGDHICFGGENFMKNIGYRQKSVYTHHAIVKHVELVNETSALMTLIHFYSTSFDENIKIRETTELSNLGYQEIYKIRYCHKTLPVETIIKRAESLTNSDTTYSLFSCNCEHFCHWCCIGNEDSYQVNDMIATIRQITAGTLNVGGKLLKSICRVLIVSLDDIAKAGVAGKALIGVPWGVIGVMALAYLIYCIYRHIKLNKDLSLGSICARCCSQQKKDIWLKFGVYCTTQVGGIGLLSLVIDAGVCTGGIAAAISVIAILSLLLMWGIPNLKNKLSSTFKGTKIKVESIDDIAIGNVISFKYLGKMHDGIVSGVTKDPHTHSKKGRISFIHYSLPNFFEPRIIQEETKEINLANDVIKCHDYSCYDVHPSEIVVKRARQRIGEKKFSIMSNRSCHFCHWAKVNEDIEDAPPQTIVPTPTLIYERDVAIGEDVEGYRPINVNHKRGKKQATKTMEKTWARIPEDVKEGQIIQFKNSGGWLYAVTTAVRCTDESILFVTVVHYGRMGVPSEENFEFDLRRDDIWIYKYHPVYRFSRADVIRRARATVDKSRYNILYHRSSHLVEEIVLKDRDQRITNFDEIQEGDVIIFYYWSLNHAAVVVKIETNESKGNNRAHVTFIHYALTTLFATRTVQKDRQLMDLSQDYFYRRNYNGYNTYPPKEVVRRAKSRLGEQRFSVTGNTSWDLVHWAKVIQTPAMVKLSNAPNTDNTPGGAEQCKLLPKAENTPNSAEQCKLLPKAENTPDSAERFILLPKVGKQYGKFQRLPVHSWNDIVQGMIVEYKYYWIWHQGILTDVDIRHNKIKVIHYGTNHIFATRTIMEDTLPVNLHQDELWMYRCEPKHCNPEKVILENAKGRLGEQSWGKENNSWNFCKACVLKGISNQKE